MGYFDWIFKYKFDNERQTLIDMRTHTIDWYNQLTEPIEPLLSDIQFDREIDSETAQKYSAIAMQIHKVKILSGAGSRLYNVLKSMTKQGIPIFTSRKKLLELAEEYQDTGLFLKELGLDLSRWKRIPKIEQEEVRRRIFDQWKNFESKKDELVDEINLQISNLG